MLKKIACFYPVAAVIGLLLLLIGGWLSIDTTVGALLLELGYGLLVLLIFTSPIWLVVLGLLVVGQPRRQQLARALHLT